MEWKIYYMDAMLIPLGLVISVGYHMWLWHKVRTQPSLTVFGIDADGRRFWVPAIIKDIEKKSIIAVQSIRNMIMGSSLMASTCILLCCGLAAVISSTYSIKKPVSESVYGAHEEYVVALKYVALLTIFLFSFLCHSLSIRFLSQVNILICIPQDDTTSSSSSMVSPEFLAELLEKANFLSIVGNRLFYTALPLLLWIFGPVLAFLCTVSVLLLLFNLDFVGGKAKTTMVVNDNSNSV